MKKKGLVKNWKELKDISKSINFDGKETLFVPMNAHGQTKEKIITCYEDELNVDFNLYEENKFSKLNTILLIGTNY